MEPLDTSNLLGPLGADDTHAIGPTEMEFNVQLPTCRDMRDKDKTQRLHFDTTYQNIQVHHWIKVSHSFKMLLREIIANATH